MENDNETTPSMALRTFRNLLVMKCHQIIHRDRFSYFAIEKFPFAFPCSDGLCQPWMFLSYDPYSFRIFSLRLFRNYPDIHTIAEALREGIEKANIEKGEAKC
ncbi:MAG: hypothetical protein ABSA46_17395 [Thermodesulfovibrionales bacterium]|jgi:hypothetical protein